MAEIDPGTLSSSDILKRFIISGLHPDGNKSETWPKETTVVCLIDKADNTQKTVIKHNIRHGNHAEAVLVEYIENEQDPAKITNITIYINYSPCSDCSVLLKKLKENFPNLQIKVKFTSLYKIKRPSCSLPESACSCREDDHKAFILLRELGARPFQKEDWDELINLLSEHFLVGLRYGHKYKVWRNGEDEKLLKDYETKSKGILPSTPDVKNSSTEHPHPPKAKHETDRTGHLMPKRIKFQSENE